MKTRNKLFLQKVETVLGIDSLPSVIDDVLILNGDSNIDIPTEQDDGADDLKGTMGPGDSVTVKQAMSLQVSTRVRGLGGGVSAALLPNLHAALIASGHTVSSTGDGLTTPREASYTPTSDLTLLKSATTYFYEDVLLYKLLGSVNNLSFEASMSALKANFTVQSAYREPAAVVKPAPEIIQAEVFRMTSALCAIDENATRVNIGAFTFDTGVDVQEAYETGAHYFEVSDRAPTITIDPRAVTSAADWQALTSATKIEVIATFTNSIGETLEFYAPNAVLSSVSTGSRGGNITREKTYSLKEESGDDQYIITWVSVL